MGQRGLNLEDVLPVMVVKDPLQWFQSTCRHQYFSFRRQGRKCPGPLANTGGNHEGEEFKSLPHLWSDFIMEYMDAKFPLLVVRYEDLLYDPVSLIGAICTCLGGKANEGKKFNILESAAKWGAGHGDYGNNRSQVGRYEKEAVRLRRELDAEDRRFLQKAIDERILDYFHYTLDVP